MVPLALALACAAWPARASALPAAAATPRIELPADRVLHAGDRVEIRWDALGGPIEELEIRLSLDGGRHYALRVSPEIDGRTASYSWRVPNLASDAARLRLRFNRDGREIDGAPGETFRIEARADRPVERDLVHEEPWWEGLERLGEHRRMPAALGAETPCLAPAAAAVAAGVETRAPVVAPAPARLAHAPLAFERHESPVALHSYPQPRMFPRRE